MSHPGGTTIYLLVMEHEGFQQAAPQFTDPASFEEGGREPAFETGAGPIPGVAPDVAAGGGAPVLSASEQAFGATPKPAKSSRPTLVQGQKGPAVVDLQAELNEAGEALAVDGMFGPLTRAAVIRFQNANFLDADGIVGPITWDALDSQGPAQPAEIPGGPLLDRPPGLPTGEDLETERLPGDVAVGDAEGNQEPDESTTAGGLETLDRDGDTDSLPGLGSPGNLFGFGEKRVPVANPNKAALLAGAFADLGNYASTGFADATLNGLLADYGKFWGIDVTAPATNLPDPTLGKGGDSAGKGVQSHPPWIKAFQNKIIGASKWDDDDRATQKLIDAFLRDFARDRGALAPGVEQLFHEIGASETNAQGPTLGASHDSNAWCGQASRFALLIGMYQRGIRFVTTKHHTDFQLEIRGQVAAFLAWTKQAGNVLQKEAAASAQLQPGDIITVVNGGDVGPLSGHVATVVEHDGDRIVYASGNAAGVRDREGAIRIEEVKREPPPPADKYDWLTISARETKFVNQKQAESKNRKEAKDDEKVIRDDQARIESQLPGVQFPKLDPTSNTSVGNYAKVAMDNANKAASPVQVQTNAADMLFRSTLRSKDLAEADAAASAQKAILADGDSLPVSRDRKVDPRFQPGLHAPAKAGVSWVVEVIRSSKLTALQVLANGQTQTVANDPALQSGTTLSQQCTNVPPDVLNKQVAK